jgi:glucose/arabinose dehydrogenase
MKQVQGGRVWGVVGIGLFAYAAVAAAACGSDDPKGKDRNRAPGEGGGAGGEGATAGVPSSGGTDTSNAGAYPTDGGTPSGGVPSGGDGGSGGEPPVTDGGAGGAPTEPSTFDCSPREGSPQLLQVTELTDAADYPVGITQPAGETERLYVVELKGLIRVLKGNAFLPEPFLDFQGYVDHSEPERGLVALAFHPNFAQNRRYFIAYTAGGTNGGTLQLSELEAANADVSRLLEKPLLQITTPGPNHIGRALAFGPDGNLYLATGDGGGSADEQLQGQLATGLLGKVLRIDVDSTPAAGKAYAIPSGNMAGGAPERWAFGLRFPLGLSFDACTGDMFLGDASSTRAEINHAPRDVGGQNYGWSMYDGTACFKPACTQAGKTFPLYETEDAFLLHGGYVYRGHALPSHRGRYFAVDRAEQHAVAFEIVNGTAVVRDLSTDLGEDAVGTQGIGQDSRGELYLTNTSGKVYRIDPEP